MSTPGGFKKLLTLCAVGALSLLTSGCFLRLLFGSVGERNTEFGRVFIAEIGGTWGPQAICDFDETGTLVDCTYTFLDFEADPPEIERTSSARLVSELGVLGLFVDPLVLQVPEGASDFAGTFDDGSGPRPVVVTRTSTFDVEPGVAVAAEAGKTFVILEFPPDAVAELESAGRVDGPFDFTFEFEVPTLSDVEVKPMFTGKVEVGGETFYPPMLPCATDFAAVSALTVPASPTSVDLMPQLLDVLRRSPNLACDGVVYDYTGVAAPPALDVVIDIKPGSDPNSIQCRSRGGVIPVAVLTTDVFDAATVDHRTVDFQGAGESHVDRRSGEARRHEEDVDGDGDTDLVFHFRNRETDLTCESTEATLTGETFAGEAFEASDAVRMIGR